MQFFGSLAEVPGDFGPSAVTVGKFDGVHLGHRAVIDSLKSVAQERGLVSTVLTFDRNPLALLRPELCPVPLTSNDQKRERVASTGVDAMLMVEFDHDFASLEPEQFVESVLVDALHAEVVLVGPDFTFGSKGKGDIVLLRSLGETHGFVVRAIDLVGDGAERVSSTRIRHLLEAGDVREATRLLGHTPAVRAVVVHGEQRGRELGYPTANLSPDHEGFIPADGVYAARLVLDGVSMPAAVSIGNNPTFEGVPDKQIEAHVLDRTLDLYGREVTVEFVDYIRPMNKFDGIASLVAQMNADELRIRDILGVPPR